MLSYIKLKKNPHNFLKLTWLKVSEFDNTLNLLHEPWSKIESQKMSRKVVAFTNTRRHKFYIYYKTYISHTFSLYLFNSPIYEDYLK